MSDEKPQDESVEKVATAVDKSAEMMAAMAAETSDAMEPDAVVNDGDVPSIFEQFETDKSAESEGRWFPVGVGMEFKIRRFISPKSINARVRAEKVIRKREKNMTDEFTPEQGLAVLKLQLAGGVIADWRGPAMRDEKGPLPFSEEAAFMLLDRFNELIQSISGYCMDVENYRRIEQEATVKNS